MLETMTEDYIRTARAKGLSRRKVIFKHGLRSALTPIVTIAGLDLASVLGGAAITEVVFNLNGIGKVGIFAIQQLDLPIIVVVVLIAAAAVVIMNFVVDLLYAVIDPRVRYT
jgi:peptide/nickel transport system permease protein